MFPELATNPYPSSKAINILHDSILSWEPGAFAQTHDVYFGTDYDKVYDATATDSLYMGRREAASYNPGQLDFGKTYYWRVDEVTDAPDYSVFSGDVWSFTVEPLSIPVETITATASASSPGMEASKTVDGSGLNELDQHSTTATDMWFSGAGAGPVVPCTPGRTASHRRARTLQRTDRQRRRVPRFACRRHGLWLAGTCLVLCGRCAATRPSLRQVVSLT